MTMEAPADEEFLLALLHTTPTVDGQRRDLLAEDADARRWLVERLGEASAPADLGRLRGTRDTLQRVVAQEAGPEDLEDALVEVARRPRMSASGVEWHLDAPPGTEVAARAVLAWDALHRSARSRLRRCANPDCSLYLIDRSKSGNARWCSMTTCGNRMKARRHYGRLKADEAAGG